jgi:hypothetical protein
MSHAHLLPILAQCLHGRHGLVALAPWSMGFEDYLHKCEPEPDMLRELVVVHVLLALEYLTVHSLYPMHLASLHWCVDDTGVARLRGLRLLPASVGAAVGQRHVLGLLMTWLNLASEAVPLLKGDPLVGELYSLCLQYVNGENPSASASESVVPGMAPLSFLAMRAQARCGRWISRTETGEEECQCDLGGEME